MTAGPSCRENRYPHSPSTMGTQQPAQASSGEDSSDNRRIWMNNQKSQEVKNICMEAYNEVMERALQLNTWVSALPAIGSIDEIQQMFRSPPQAGKIVEASTASATVPIHVGDMVAKMTNVRAWAASQWPFVIDVVSDDSHIIVQRLKEADDRVTNAQMVRATFKLPTPFVPTRNFYFLRFEKEIMPHAHAIIDVSEDYFPLGHEQECRRRPSGVIVRKFDSDCEVIWVENVEVPVPQQNIYSPIINENLAFCARHWVSRLLQSMKPYSATFTNLNMNVHERARASLLVSSTAMRLFFMECSNHNPPESGFSTMVGEGEIRVLKNDVVQEVAAYIGLTSFHVQVKPLSVFQFLVKKNLQLQWPQLPNSKQPEELLKFATNDDGDCITLHREEMGQLITYRLQVTSRDEFCSFILSAPMSEQDVNDVIGSGNSKICAYYQTSGFAIMPDGPGGLQSDGSLVTIAFQQHFQEGAPYTCAAMVYELYNAVNAIIREINEEVAGGDNL